MEGKIIVVTSGKGGVGKSTATANIGAALAMEGKRVAIVDMDIGLRNLDVIMGLENRIVFTVVDAVKGNCQLKQAAIKDRRIENLYLIPASQSDNKDVLRPRKWSAFHTSYVMDLILYCWTAQPALSEGLRIQSPQQMKQS